MASPERNAEEGEVAATEEENTVNKVRNMGL